MRRRSEGERGDREGYNCKSKNKKELMDSGDAI